MRSERLRRIKEEVKEAVLDRLDLTKETDDSVIEDMIEEEIIKKSRAEVIDLAEKLVLWKEIFNSLRRLDMLQELIEDKSITEIMINGPNHIFIEQNGRMKEWYKKFESKERLEDVIQQIVSASNRMVNEANPIVDVRLQDGSRVNVVLYPIALEGPVVTIRKFPDQPIDIAQLLAFGSVTEEAAAFLEKLVIAKYNIFISGGTGSGKTTFLNALSNFIPADERIITIEDSAELQIKNIPNLVRLETRNANVEGKNAISIRELIKTSLRMRPDRIVVGEIRDGAAIDMLSAMNTGHDGSLSTGHANSTEDMLSRLETLVLMGVELPLPAIRRQIASAIDIIVHLGRLRDKTRKVLEIVEILDCREGEIQTNPLYQFVEEGEENGKVIGALKRTENQMYHTEKMERAGICI